MIKKYKNIIWDWNGTLLNDISICVSSMNRLLEERNLPKLNHSTYKQLFTFPVRQYYEAIGFDFCKEPFDIPALKFIDYYHECLPSVGLFNEAASVLKKIESLGCQQFILSAMEQNTLAKSVSDLGIANYFKCIKGIGDHFARSKVQSGKELFKEQVIHASETVLIGDTLHDMEVAEQLGVSCILIAQGHQSYDRLKINGNVVLQSLNDLIDCL